MGTRNLVAVKINGEYKVGVYKWWKKNHGSGFPSIFKMILNSDDKYELKTPMKLKKA